LGAKVVACSDSNGVIYAENGLCLDTIKQIKEVERRRIQAYIQHHPSARYLEKGNIWDIPCQVALPCATQNEMDSESAKTLINNGCIAIAEGANMPLTSDAVRTVLDAGIAYGPGKAANAG